MEQKSKVLFRIDDIGASSKLYNQYGKTIFRIKGIPVFYFPFANFSFLKRIWPFKGWGPYQELTVAEWREFLDIFKAYNIQPVVGITACWVDETDALIPFPEKFPEEAALLKEALKKNEIIIANHGLTHCVVGKHLPRFAHSNRLEHREFWPNLPEDIHREHVQKSQAILEKFFEQNITIFIPPGNVWCKKTYRALKETSITQVNCNHYMLDSTEEMQGIEFVDDRKGWFVLHDRDLKLYKSTWLKKHIQKYNNASNL